MASKPDCLDCDLNLDDFLNITDDNKDDFSNITNDLKYQIDRNALHVRMTILMLPLMMILLV